MKQPSATRWYGRIAFHRWQFTWIVAAGMLLAAASVGLAQNSEPVEARPIDRRDAGNGPAVDHPPAVPQIPDKAGRIQYVGPDTFILLDEQGRPQPVPGMTYEDFMAAWKQSQRAANGVPGPRYSIDSIAISGTANETHARLKFTAEVSLLIDEPLEVPLGLPDAILVGTPLVGKRNSEQAHEGDGADRSTNGDPSEYVYFHPKRGGFVVHLVGRAGDRRTISLNLIVALVRDGTETTLPLECVRALSSSLELLTNKPAANTSINRGTIVANENAANGGSVIKAAGAMGSIRLTWQSGNPAAGEVATVLGAEGAIHVSIDGRSARTDARLTVQSFGGGFDRFRVQLPSGAQLVRDVATADEPQQVAYRVTLEPPPKEGEADAGQIVLVQLAEKQQRPAVVELTTEQPIGIEEGAPTVALGGFEVLGAVRQFGDIAVEVAGDWQTRWEIGNHVRQVDPNDLGEELQRANLTAAFQYDRQPCSLGVRIVPREFRVHVTPRYDLKILSDEAQLRVRLTYQVFGSRAFEFRVDLAGWEVTEEAIDSGGLVDQDRVYVATDDTLVLPLAQSSTRRAEINFVVRRPLASDLARVRLPLPVAHADAVGTGELEVSGAADMDLQPDLSSSVGLTATPVTMAPGAANAIASTPHRFRTSLPKAVFVADRVRRAREVSANASAQIDLHGKGALVDQRFEYTVRYEPMKELRFAFPPNYIIDLDELEITLLETSAVDDADSLPHETPLNFMSTDFAPERLLTVVTGQLRVALPQPRLGKFEVRIRYEAPRPETNDEHAAFEVPLFQQLDGVVGSQIASVRAPQTLMATLAESAAWKALDSRTASPTPRKDDAADQYDVYEADGEAATLPLLLRAVDPNLPSSTTVERVWLQTWISGDVRQDRAAFQYRTTASQTTIELPPQVPPDEVEVLVDGRPAQLVSRGAGRLVVRPERKQKARDGEPHLETVELRYRQAAPRGLIRRHRLTPPQIVGTTALSDVYWQIVLPADRHVVKSPERMPSASQWQWLGSFWGHRPRLGQADLEKWCGASPQLAPVAADNAYLFTGLAPVSTIDVVTAPRWLIVLLASSGALAMVLVGIYTPVARRGWAVVGLALLIAGTAISYPVPAFLLGQASVLGLVAGGIAVFIARVGRRRSRWPVVLSSGSSQRHVTPRGDSILMPPATAAASTAPTASLGIPERER
jgi:hypothetical protein